MEIIKNTVCDERHVHLLPIHCDCGCCREGEKKGNGEWLKRVGCREEYNIEHGDAAQQNKKMTAEAIFRGARDTRTELNVSPAAMTFMSTSPCMTSSASACAA